jgi:L-ribulose-5-phosphate 3-epimerase
MNRRHFVGLAAFAVVAQGLPRAFAAAPVKPFALGVVIKPFGAPDEHLRTVHELGFPTVFLSMDQYLGSFTPELAKQYRELLAKYQLTATTIEVVGPPPLEWNFMQGPSTIGIVPPNTRAARIDALRQASDFAKLGGHSAGTNALRVYS